MTEEEWLAGEDLGAMLDFAALSARKLRLFTAARVRLDWDQLEHAEFRHAVEASERFADFPVLRRDLEVEEYHASGRLMRYGLLGPDEGPAARAGRLACLASSLELCSDDAVRLGRDCEAATSLLREVAGNPFRPVAPGPGRFTPDTRSVAQAAYAERHLPSGRLDNACLSVLADALEEAGCTNEDLLAHLRSVGPHVRGCWALDLVLGKG